MDGQLDRQRNTPFFPPTILFSLERLYFPEPSFRGFWQHEGGKDWRLAGFSRGRVIWKRRWGWDACAVFKARTVGDQGYWCCGLRVRAWCVYDPLQPTPPPPPPPLPLPCLVDLRVRNSNFFFFSSVHFFPSRFGIQTREAGSGFFSFFLSSLNLNDIWFPLYGNGIEPFYRFEFCEVRWQALY